ncbi:DUF6522 family protein [Phaeovulum sp.]|uniref:DUF6522 family protein n=1 Tax=Phaeovulum sp. TaxID=2934796 RepID=UPI0039E63165
MTKLEITEGMIQIDAGVLSRAFELSPDELKGKMRDGAITSRVEYGEAEDAGKIRLTFFSQERRVRITADRQGNVLACDKARIEPSAQALDVHWTAEALLDEALAESFPASDPIAVSFEAPPRHVSASRKPRTD